MTARCCRFLIHNATSINRDGIVELHLFELVREQTIYIIGVYITGTHQLSPLPTIFRCYNRSSSSDKRNQLAKVQFIRH